jgi:predicted RNA methylase
MSTVPVGMVGAAPKVVVGLSSRPPEKELYTKLWEMPSYRDDSPGEVVAQQFLQQARPKPGATVLDLGCGTGRGGLQLALFGGMNVTMVDFAPNCLDQDIRDMLEAQKHTLRFVEDDLNTELKESAEYGFCTDVMEHIRPHRVDIVLNHILRACQHVFFLISTKDDVKSKLVGHTLHLSVHSYEWWLQKFNDRGCLIHYSQNFADHCIFYVSAWSKGTDITEVGVLNIAEEKMRTNVKHNIAQGWQQVVPHPTNDMELMIVGGGPSVLGQLDKIKELRAAGVKLITINGAYKWCIDQGLAPSGLVMVDARPHNARFSKPVIDECKYFIASQCDPTVFEGLPKDRTYIWHTTAELIRDLLIEQYEEGWYPVPGGSTVLLRAIPLFRMLGFKRFHLFGCDSCLEGDAHHIYEQVENNGAPVIRVTVGGKIFYCHLWMTSQAQEFMDLIKFLGSELEIEIYGDGLLSWILQTGANLQLEKEALEVVAEEVKTKDQ